jgi:formyltetrahydrofolate synthetase
MKTEFVPKERTKDRKMARIIASMTEKEAYQLMTDLFYLRKVTKQSETMATWKLATQLKDYFDRQAPMVTSMAQ